METERIVCVRLYSLRLVHRALTLAVLACTDLVQDQHKRNRTCQTNYADIVPASDNSNRHSQTCVTGIPQEDAKLLWKLCTLAVTSPVPTLPEHFADKRAL